MKSTLVERIIKSARPIIDKMTLDAQRTRQTTFYKMKPLPSGVIYETAEDCPFNAEWVIPEDEDPDCVIFYTHGGGYGMGDLLSSRAVAAPIAKKTKIRVFSFEYRLAPEYPFPAALDDAQRAYMWLLKLGYQPKNIIAMGESAGGGLAVSNVLMLREKGIGVPSCIVAISPWADLTETGRSYLDNKDRDPLLSTESLIKLADAYVGDESPLNPYISPVYAKYDEDFPPILIQVGGKEVLLDDAKELCRAMTEDGVYAEIEYYEDMWHVFHIWQIEQADKAIASIADFINRKMM